MAARLEDCFGFQSKKRKPFSQEQKEAKKAVKKARKEKRKAKELAEKKKKWAALKARIVQDLNEKFQAARAEKKRQEKERRGINSQWTKRTRYAFKAEVIRNPDGKVDESAIDFPQDMPFSTKDPVTNEQVFHTHTNGLVMNFEGISLGVNMDNVSTELFPDTVNPTKDQILKVLEPIDSPCHVLFCSLFFIVRAH